MLQRSLVPELRQSFWTGEDGTLHGRFGVSHRDTAALAVCAKSPAYLVKNRVVGQQGAELQRNGALVPHVRAAHEPPVVEADEERGAAEATRALAAAGLITRVEVFVADVHRREVTYTLTDRGSAVLRWSASPAFDWLVAS